MPHLPRARIGIDAGEETISQRDALIGWQHEGILRKCFECGSHEGTIGWKAQCVEAERGEDAL